MQLDKKLVIVLFLIPIFALILDIRWKVQKTNPINTKTIQLSKPPNEKIEIGYTPRIEDQKIDSTKGIKVASLQKTENGMNNPIESEKPAQVEELQPPPKPITTILYVVEDGMGVWKIVSHQYPNIKNNSDKKKISDWILEKNNLSISDIIQRGRRLQIPDETEIERILKN